MFGTKVSQLSLIAIGLLLFIGAAQASASPVSDVADGLNETLFGGTNIFAAQAILTAAVMVAVGLPLAYLGMNLIGTMIILFTVLCALTAIGWADPTILLVAVLLAVGLFVKVMVGYFTGEPGASSDE